MANDNLCLRVEIRDMWIFIFHRKKQTILLEIFIFLILLFIILTALKIQFIYFFKLNNQHSELLYYIWRSNNLENIWYGKRKSD